MRQWEQLTREMPVPVPGRPAPPITPSARRSTDMMALKHHQHDMIVAAAATTDEDAALKLLHLEWVLLFQGGG